MALDVGTLVGYLDLDTSRMQRSALGADLVLDELSRQIESVDGRDVDIDVATPGAVAASAQLAMLEREVDKLDGRTVNVRVDRDGSSRAAAQSLFTISGQLASSAAEVGAKLATWGPLLAAAGGAAAVLLPSVAVLAPALIGAGGAMAVLALGAMGFMHATAPFANSILAIQAPISAIMNSGLKELFTDLATVLTPALKVGLGGIAAGLNTILTGIVQWLALRSTINPLIEIMTTFGQILSSQISPLVQAVLSTFLTLGQAALPGLNQLLGIITSLAQRFDDFLTNMPEGALQNMISTAVSAIGTILTVVGQVMSALQPMFAAVGPPVIALLATIGTAVASLAPAFGGLGAIMGTLLTALTPVISMLASTLAPVIGQLVALVAPLIAQLATLAGAVLSQLLAAVTPVLPVIVSLAGTFATLAGQVLSALIPALTPLLSAVLSLVPAITPIIGLIASFAGTLLGALVPAITPIIGLLAKTATQVITALMPAIVTLTPVLGTLIQAFVKILVAVLPILPPLIQLVGAVLGVVPPVVRLAALLLTTLLPAVTAVIGIFASLIAAILGPIATGLGKLITVITTVVTAVVAKFSEGVSWLVQAASGIPGKVVGALAGLADKLATIGRQAVQGLIDGITGMVGALTKKAESIANAITGTFRKVLDIHSPSRVMVEIGEYIGDGLLVGLQGSTSTVDATINKIADQVEKGFRQRAADLTEVQKNASDAQVKALEDQKDAVKRTADAQIDALTRQGRAHGANTKQIANQKDVIRQAADDHIAQINRQIDAAKAAGSKIAEINLQAAVDSTNATLASLSKMEVALHDIADQRDANAEAIKAATTKLEDAIKFRDDFASKIATQAQQIGALSSITGADDGSGSSLPVTISDLISGLSGATASVTTYTSALAQLRSMGLNDTLYAQLAEMGATTGQAYANAILQAGPAGVSQLNALSDQLGTASKALGDSTAKVLYQAGVDSAQGLLDGLKSKEQALLDEANAIADQIASAIRKVLDIHSPSRVMAEIGGYVGQGLADGIAGSAGLVARSASDIAGIPAAMSATIPGVQAFTRGDGSVADQVTSGSTTGAPTGDQFVFNLDSAAAASTAREYAREVVRERSVMQSIRGRRL